MSVYRVMIVGGREAVVHWQLHKRGMVAQREYQEWGEEAIPAAIVIGGDPGTLLTGALPVPYPIDKQLFAGIVRGEGMEVYELPNGVPVPARAEVVLEGYIDLGDLRSEGPYGDHFGYYDKPSRPFPTFKLERVWLRESPIYYGSVTGKPILEDAVIGKAAERIFLPIIRTLLPEVVDLNLPPAGLFQGVAVVSIKKSYPGHAKKVGLALMGLGQLSLTKIFIVVDHDINVHDWNQVLWALASHVDPQRDVLVLPNTHTDELDPSTPTPGYGSKLLIDATRKLPEEYGGREWPEEVKPDPETVRLVDSRWGEYGL
jgi:4-hydroxy-3-polyprenylbenzoate decarboxylase